MLWCWPPACCWPDCPFPQGPSVSGSNPFRDVASGDYFYRPVLWAVRNNITAGTSATTFSPNDGCTRGQIVTFLYKHYAS